MDLRDITNLAIATLRVRPWSIEDVLETCKDVDKNISQQDLGLIEKTLIEEVLNKSTYANRPVMLYKLALKAQTALDKQIPANVFIEYNGRYMLVDAWFLIEIIKDKLCGADE